MADRPPVTSDFYDLEALLDEQDRATLHRVRAFMDEQVEPIINEWWTRAQFPRQPIPGPADPRIATARRARACMDEQVGPIINEWWTRAQFPRQLIPGLAELGIAGAQYSGYGSPGRSSLFDGMVSMELGRGDPSVATFIGVHGGPASGALHLCASGGQKERRLPRS